MFPCQYPASVGVDWAVTTLAPSARLPVAVPVRDGTRSSHTHISTPTLDSSQKRYWKMSITSVGTPMTTVAAPGVLL